MIAYLEKSAVYFSLSGSWWITFDKVSSERFKPGAEYPAHIKCSDHRIVDMCY
jgi:hypothetical protein